MSEDTPKSTRSGAKKTNPCGKCQDECGSGNAVVCGFCELWYHSKRVEGMTPAFIQCCDVMNKHYGGSSFLCIVCRKVMGMFNQSMKEMKDMAAMEQRLATAALERNCMAAKIENLESNQSPKGIKWSAIPLPCFSLLA